MALNSLTPAVVSPGSAPFVLTVTGQNFQNGSTVKWNGTPLTTTFASATQLTASVPASLVAQAGTAQVTVVDPLGGTSGAVTFQIAVVNALPPGQPAGSPGGGPSPLPGARQPAGAPLGNPNPLPPSR
ncbi:MAG: IPT/TIG domain-containing protein [Thermomicrobiales bacterium]